MAGSRTPGESSGFAGASPAACWRRRKDSAAGDRPFSRQNSAAVLLLLLKSENHSPRSSRYLTGDERTCGMAAHEAI